MAREVLGKGGLGFTHWEVSVVTDPEAKSPLGYGGAFIDFNCLGQRGGVRTEGAIWMNGAEVDKMIALLREAKRKLLEAGAA